MKYIPEEIEQGSGIPHAEPGRYEMMIVRHKEDVQTKNGIKDVIDFVGTKVGEPAGQDFGASLWISGPGTRQDGTQSKGTLWQLRRLAEALGPEALEQYREKDANGHGQFRPNDWKDIPVLITVSAYGVDTIEKIPASRIIDDANAKEAAKKKTDDIPF